MPYSIFVFNQCALGEISADELESDLKKISFYDAVQTVWFGSPAYP